MEKRREIIILWIWAVIGPIVGWVACWFVMRNNPEWFDLQKKVKEIL